MLLGVLILLAAGIYVCVKGQVQASSTFLIRGKPATHIGVVLIMGGLLPVVLPTALNSLGVLKAPVGTLLLSVGIMFAALAYVAVLILAEKRRPMADAKKPAAPENDVTTMP